MLTTLTRVYWRLKPRFSFESLRLRFLKITTFLSLPSVTTSKTTFAPLTNGAPTFYIENVDLIVTDGPCSFGNGVEVSVLNETGGREVKIFDRLSAQIAYVLAMYRHRPDLIARMNADIDAYAVDMSGVANGNLVADSRPFCRRPSGRPAHGESPCDGRRARLPPPRRASRRI